MTKRSLSLEPATLIALRDAKLDAALARWSDPESDNELLQSMRAKAKALALTGVLNRMDNIGDSRGPAGLVVLAEALLNGKVTPDDLLAVGRAPEFTDRHRAVALLYAAADPKRSEQAIHLLVLRLVGDTAADPELAARAYLRLGDLSSHDDRYAAHAYGAGLNKAVETDLRDVQAGCLLALAKCALRMKRPPDAVENASLARRLFESDGDAERAEAAAIVEAVGRLENADPGGAADVLRPIVTRQLAQGVNGGAVDASVLLTQCIRAAARPAFQQAGAADGAAVTTYDAALALAGDTGYQYPDEAADRTLIGQCLIRGDDREAGARQLMLAVEVARTGVAPESLLNALQALCDWLVHTHSPDAIAHTEEALGIARAIGDKAALPGVLVLHASALRQSNQLDRALEAYAEANALEFRIAYRVGLITALFEAGREDAALAAVSDLNAAIREREPDEFAGDEAHVALLLDTLVRSGHPGLAQQIRTQLEAKGDAGTEVFGSERRIFTKRAQETLARAGVHMAAGQYDAVAKALEPLLGDSQRLSEQAIELRTSYALGENAQMAGRFDDAIGYLQAVIDKAEGVFPALQAAAFNKLGTVFTLGYQNHGVALEFQQRALALHREHRNPAGLVVSLIQAAQTCVVLGRLEQADTYADELRDLGPRYPPQDVEWVTYVPALVDAHLHRWERAKVGYRKTIAELERKRAQFSTAAGQRQWCEQKAFMYGNAMEAAIVAGDCEEAITHLELARNRYLDGVAREHGIQRGSIRPGFDMEGRPTPLPLQEVIGQDCALVWIGGFPRGLGVVAAWRNGNALELTSDFCPEITGADLTGWFHGDVSQILAAHRAGRSVELVIEMALAERDLNYGANPYWQGRGEDWNRSIGEAVDKVSRDIWPKILATVGRAVHNVVLLPSVGCSELPLIAAAPDAWPDGTPLAVSMSPGLDALPSPERTRLDAPGSLVQAVNPSEDAALLCCPIEAAAVRELFEIRPVVLRGRRATTRRVADALNGADVFHFMGHAFCEWRDPLDSGLICAKRKGGTGVLTVRELFDLVGAVETRLVVLSACQIGNVQAGDKQNDFINLPSALIAAGARAVIAPRWLVDDVAASMLLAKMFQCWRCDGMPVAVALGRARRWLRDEVTRRDVERWLEPGEQAVNAQRLNKLKQRYVETYRSDERPFHMVAHWGAFELTGDPQPFGENHA